MDEAPFALKMTTSDTSRFNYALVSLDEATPDVVSDLIEQLPISDKYSAIKSRIIGAFG